MVQSHWQMHGSYKQCDTSILETKYFYIVAAKEGPGHSQETLFFHAYK